jgi:hypothetical protein
VLPQPLAHRRDDRRPAEGGAGDQESAAAERAALEGAEVLRDDHWAPDRGAEDVGQQAGGIDVAVDDVGREAAAAEAPDGAQRGRHVEQASRDPAHGPVTHPHHAHAVLAAVRDLDGPREARRHLHDEHDDVLGGRDRAHLLPDEHPGERLRARRVPTADDQDARVRRSPAADRS